MREASCELRVPASAFRPNNRSVFKFRAGTVGSRGWANRDDGTDFADSLKKTGPIRSFHVMRLPEFPESFVLCRRIVVSIHGIFVMSRKIVVFLVVIVVFVATVRDKRLKREKKRLNEEHS